MNSSDLNPLTLHNKISNIVMVIEKFKKNFNVLNS